MKGFLVRVCEHSGNIASLLNTIDRSAVQNGRLLITPRMITDIMAILAGDALRFDRIATDNEGTIHINAVYGGMTLAYTLKIIQCSVSNGNADGRIAYTEQRRGGGIGGAFLGITGKSGISVALSKYPNIKVTDHEILFSVRGVPVSWRAFYHAVSPEGILFRVS